MASGKQNPRQKMINMMYLVLTALLALNVSKSVLDSFVAIDESQIKTRTSISQKLEGQLAVFELRKNTNEEKFGPNYDRAIKVHKAAQDLITHINRVKAKTIAITEGLEMNEVYDEKMDTVLSVRWVDRKDDFDNNTRVLYGTGVTPDPILDNNRAGENPEGYNYRAAELKKRLIIFKEMLVNNFSDNTTLVSSVNEMFDFDGIKDIEGNDSDWETLNFYDVPLAATSALLSKIQSDILSAESDAVGAIFGDVDVRSYKFNTLSEAVIPESSFVTQGGKFRADVFLAAYDDKNKPTILLGNPGVKFDSVAGKLDGEYTELDLFGTKGLVEIPAGSVGPKHREGVIIFEPAGLPTVTKRFELDYTVAAPTLVASPTNMNVLYRGLQNPVSISVPGFLDSEIVPSVSNGTLTRGENGYLIQPGDGPESVISCRATLPDGSSRMIGNIEFRVKTVPSPVAYLGGKGPTDSKISKAQLLAARRLQVKLKDFVFDGVRFTINSFELVTKVRSETQLLRSNSARLSNEMIQVLEKPRSGQKIYIENIKATGPGGVTRPLPKLSLEVI